MDDLKALIRQLGEENKLLIESVSMSETGGTIKVVCDREEGIDSLTLVKFSREIMKTELYDSRYAENFKLEVSSPGIDAPLTKEFHFRRNIGHDAEISHESETVDSPLSGTILDCSDKAVTLETGKGKKKESIELPLDKIISGRIILKW